VASFVTDANGNGRASSPRRPTTPPAEATPTATFVAGHWRTTSSASTAGDTRPVERSLISSGSPYEAVFGFSRAVRVGQQVFVAGTAPIMPDGANPPADAYGQTRRCLEIILAALAEAGAGPEHVVRTRVFATSGDYFDEVARAHGDVFTEIRPASTYVVVAGLLDPRWFVELEADAVVP
jgi:enamine deaminase RidA (YjgF/YER057c/UK114 family)